MMARPDNLIAQARTQAATATRGDRKGDAGDMSMLLLAAGAAWPQAGSPPPALGVQEPAPQASPQQAAPATVGRPRAEENPGLINEIGKLFDKLLRR